MKKIEIILASTLEEAKNLVEAGYCPVETSFGGENVVDEFMLDHHGSMSYMESVAIRAYRDFYSKRVEDPRFVINHIDADCIFAVASLAGLLPHATHPKKFVAPEWEQDLLPLAETIATIDTDPIGRNILTMAYGPHLVTWNALFGNSARTELEAIAGVQGWITLLTSRSAETFLCAACKTEQTRIEQARLDEAERGLEVPLPLGTLLRIRGSRMFGFDVWYGRQPELGDINEIEGWRHPVVISLVDQQRNVTFACPNKEVAEKLFGEGGLKNVFARLNEVYNTTGFGGRETIGGSPRNKVISYEEFDEYIKIVEELAHEHAF